MTFLFFNIIFEYISSDNFIINDVYLHFHFIKNFKRS